MKKNSYLLLIVLAFSCTTVPITGRKQFKLLPASTLNSMSLTNYKEFLSTHSLSNNATQSQMVKRIGVNIADATARYFKATGKSKLLAGYKWEFNLVEDATANAWCMPGGKVVVYTGLLPITQNEDALAAVMGHEIAHAIANHGNERMTQGIATELGGVGLSVALANKPQETQNLFMTAYGAGTTLGMLLPYSRLHETEADKIGLILMAMAGYNPEAAVPFWERMGKAGGQAPPAILSTHPTNESRIKNLKANIPLAKSMGAKYKK